MSSSNPQKSDVSYKQQIVIKCHYQTVVRVLDLKTKVKPMNFIYTCPFNTVSTVKCHLEPSNLIKTQINPIKKVQRYLPTAK